MSNFRLYEPDAVLIHVPKTGGKSFREGVWKGKYDGPIFGEIPNDWLPIFKFGFVRHPCDRIFSAWKMFADGAVSIPNSGWLSSPVKRRMAKLGLWRSTPPLCKDMSFSEFLDIALDDAIGFDVQTANRQDINVRIRHHTIPMSHPYNCLQYADHIGRYEKLEDEFRQLSDRLGISGSLPALNSTWKSDWKNHFSARDVERCRVYYDDDFKEFGYEL